MDRLLQPVTTILNQALNVLNTNIYVSTAVTLFLVMYGGLAAPALPPRIAAFFENPVFKLLILFLVLIVRNYNPTISILTAVAFVISMQTLNNLRIFTMAQEIAEVEGEMQEEGEEYEETEEAEEGAEAMEEEYGPMPEQPPSATPVLPETPEQVAALLHPDGRYQGPQGMQLPRGYPGAIVGASYGTPDSQL